MDFRNSIASLVTDSFMDEMTVIRRHLHRHPELSFREHQTSEYIRKLLENWGIRYRYPFAGTGILAMISGSGEGACIALRADMDALPVTETTGLEFASENEGIMHACGHDVHMTSLLGAIRVLDQLKGQFRGEVLFVFQPGEEKLPGGAKRMLEEGIFSEKRPDAIIAQHVLPEMESGHVGFRAGTYMASSDEIYITVRGKGGHAALPQQIKDPVMMAAHILITLQQEISRLAPSGVPTVLSFGKVDARGAVNVIPDEVLLEGTFRTMNEQWRKSAHDHIRKISSGIASGMGGDCQVEIRHGYPVLYNNDELTLRAREKAISFLGADMVEEMDIRMTAEDFAWFLQAVPGMMYRLGVGTPGAKQLFPLHTSGFRVDESALRTGISLLAFLAVELLETDSH